MAETSQATWDLETVVGKSAETGSGNGAPSLTASVDDDNKPTRVITVRLPRSLHEALKDEAKNRSTSLNQLCVAKLLQVIDSIQVENEG
ncbi:MAG: toxin-antitoxin system HicB family antitoxin [Planctomycetes bacterium]|nr:toxin-antitoxin system HicB family antitoxin [Planctomycetota bacterium]